MSKLSKELVWCACIGFSLSITACGGSTNSRPSDSSELVISAPSIPDAPAPNDYELPEGMDEEGNRAGFKPATVCENNSCPNKDKEESAADRVASSIPYYLYTRGQK